MKRTCVLLLILFLAAFSFPAFSMEYVAGARGGYFIWDSWLQKCDPMFKPMDEGSGVLYGPVASILFTQDLYFSVSGLFGKQSTNGTSENLQHSATTYKTMKYSFETFRMDIDSALSYRIADYFKIFGGYKYWDLETKFNNYDYRYNLSNILTEVFVNNWKMNQKFHGTAIGFGFSVPIGNKGVFIAANISGIYMFGKMDINIAPAREYKSSNGWAYNETSGSKANFDLRAYGVNFEPSIGLNAGEGLLVFTLGLRYQVNRTKAINGQFENGNPGWLTDQIYGIFVGVIYSI